MGVRRTVPMSHVAVELTAGVHNITVQGGTAYLVDRDNKTQTAVTKAPATSMIVLSADEAPAGMVFDRWAVYLCGWKHPFRGK